MHTLIAIGEIKSRAEAIGLTISGLAAKAGLAPSTALRLKAGRTQEGRPSTRLRLVEALEAEEARVADHLHKLKGAA